MFVSTSRETTPLPLIVVDVPESLTVTSGTTTPISIFGVTPTVPDIARVELEIFRLPVVVVETRGDPAVTDPIGRFVSEKSESLS